MQIDNCDVLEKYISPYCSFPAPWTKTINQEIKANGGYTISFWYKANLGTKIAERRDSWGEDPETMRRMVFFSKMSPPEVLAEFQMTNSDLVNVRLYGSCSDAETENMGPGPGTIENGVWYHAAVSLGVTNDDGKKGMLVFSGSSGTFDFADWDWCRDETMDFIQGIQLPGGVIMSPIEITSSPLPVKEIQKRFYEEYPNFQLRRGPRVDDRTRMTKTIPYVRNTFTYPVSLVSPPIVLQTRNEKTDVCKNKLGGIFQKKIWKETLDGVACKLPYECDISLVNTSTSLMSCSRETGPSIFFGQSPLVCNSVGLK